MLRYWLPHSPMYLLKLTQDMRHWTLPVSVPTPPKWSKNVSMCLFNLLKNLVHGDLIDAEILTSPFAQAGQDVYLPMGVNTFQVTIKMFGHLVMGPSVCGTSPLPYICANTSIHWRSPVQMFLCVSENSEKNSVHGALIDAEILTSPLPYIFVHLGPVIRYQYSIHWCANTSQVV